MSASGPPRQLVVANVRARGLRVDQARLRRIASICHGRASLVETTSVASAEEALRRFAPGPQDTCIFAGGDGTFMAGLSALLGVAGAAASWPTVGLVPVGTVGTVARNLGLTGLAEVLLEDWLAAGGGDRAPTTSRSTLQVRSRLGGVTREHVGFIFGTGLVARFFDVYEAQGSGGLPLAARIVARVFAESIFGGDLAGRILTPMPASLVADGVAQSAPAYSLLCASVVPDLGLGMRVTYRGAERPDRMHLVASSLPPRSLGPRMPLVLAGRRIGGRRHFDDLVARFEVTFPVNEGRFVLDGDSFRADDVEVTMGPTLRLLEKPARA